MMPLFAKRHSGSDQPKKSVQQVVRKQLIQISLLILMFMALMVNLGFTWFFGKYVEQIRQNEVVQILETAKAAMADGSISAEERTALRQASNQSGAHALIEDTQGREVFDSLLSGNNVKRQLLSKARQVIALDELQYESYGLEPSDFVLRIGQAAGWQLSEEEVGLVIGVNVTLLLGLAAALPVIWYLSRWLSVKFSNPMVQMSRATRAIHKGHYERVDLEKSDTLELHELGEAIENLAKALDAQEKLRERLTADIAHELRSPLAVMRSQLESLMDGVFEPSEERLGRLHAEVLRLTRLIDDLGELSRIENKLYVLDLAPVDLSALLEQAAEDFELLIEDKGLTFLVEVSPGLNLVADGARIRQIIINLLSNALKFTDVGTISLGACEKENGICLWVSDTGVGISEADLPHVFERFYRADPSRSRATGGAGIGLAIVEQLVRVHDGDIRMESALGRGTRVTLCFEKQPIFISSS